MKFKTCCCVGALMLVTHITNAQNKVAAELTAEYVPFSNYVRPEDSLKTGSTSDFKRMKLTVMIPFSFRKREADEAARWFVVLDGAYAKMTNRDYEKPLFPTEMLNAQVGLKHIIPMKKNWSLYTMAGVGVYTDLAQIDRNDVLLQGGVIFVKQFNPRLAAGLGPVVSNAFGVPMVMPGLYFSWTTGTKFKVNVNLPEGADIGYQFNPNLGLKAVLGLSGMTVEKEKDGKSILLGYQQITAGLRPEVRLNKSWTVGLTAGTTLARSFKESERSLKGIFSGMNKVDPRFTTTFYGAISLKLNMP